MIIKYLIVLFYIIEFAKCMENFLQFIPSSEVTERKSVYELDLAPIIVDAFQENQVLIKYIQDIGDLNFPNIKFNCHVKTLNTSYRINKAEFCKKGSLSADEDCHIIAKDSQKVKFDDVMDFDIRYDPATGMTALLKLEIGNIKSRKIPFNGLYYCKLTNSLGFISSNYIEIQDFEFYKKKILAFITRMKTEKFDPTPISDITTNSFPMFLDCGKPVGDFEEDLPSWANKDLLSPFTWSLCHDSVSGIDCFSKVIGSDRTKSRLINDVLSYYQFPNGTILLMGLKGSGMIQGGMVCSTRLTSSPSPFAIYLVKSANTWRSINFKPVGEYNKKIHRLSPQSVNIVIREGCYKTTSFKLNALYVANPDHTKVSAEWKKNGYSLPATYESGPYHLKFPSEISEADMGTYVLKISQSEPYDSITFTYTVTIIGVPKLKNSDKFPSIIYRTVEQSVNLAVSFERNITKKSIEINGVELDLSSEERKINSLKDLAHKFPLLTDLSMNGDLENTEDQGMIKYEATNLYRNKDSPQPKTHTVTFVASNNVGMSKASSLVRVFEIPTFSHYLNQYNCTSNCRSDEPHIFRCNINEQDYLSEGCTIKYIWRLNTLSLDSMSDRYVQKAYFKIDNGTVILSKVKTDNPKFDETVIEMLQKAYLSCQIVIYEPAKAGQTSTVKLYDSDNYPDLKSLLEAKISLQVNGIDTARTHWILPFTISLIVLVCIVVLILFFCLRGSGETYNVDQKERAQGHDPEKEIRDNEIFQPYERDHETNIIQPSHISFNDDDSVGVGSDDGELDVYDIDPGKFNEEGSFIGLYASDPRRPKANGEK